MSYVSSLYHIVFSTYCRRATITNEYREKLYAVIATEIKNMRSKALIVNGVHDHIHILLSLSPEVALSDLMRNVKSRSSVWAKQSGYFPLFEGWEREYGAFSLSAVHKDAVYKYIENQQDHHNVTSFDIEFNRLILKAGLTLYKMPDD
ncbi:MAG: IS200/IS605 family transposase [Bacteroidales bacterium]|nr:IS200/IS605 family transposase [Bacteroidales bacterium]